MYNINELSQLNLGRQGENKATTIQIDVSEWIAEFPNANINILVLRNGDTSPYIANATVENGILNWAITVSDTEKSGMGKAEIRATVDDIIKKSAVAVTYVIPSLEGEPSPTPPDPAQSWVDTVIEAKESIENMSATAEVDNNVGTPSVTVEKTTIDDHTNLHFYFKNLKGSDGATDYEALTNKPKINNVELSGNKSLSDLGINIPEVDTHYNSESNNAQSGVAVAEAVAPKSDKNRILEYIGYEQVTILYPDYEIKTIKITGYKHGIPATDLTGDFIIPDTIEGYTVTSIGNNAFRYCSYITSIGIPDAVTELGDYTFQGCTELSNITMPNSIVDIGSHTFDGCTGLRSINIPANVTTIGNYAFNGCSYLRSINIPANVTTIGNYAFNGCTRLRNVYYEGSEADWNNITIMSGNEKLTSATIHYNQAPAVVQDIYDYHENTNDFELIETITLDTDTAEIVRQVDPLGNAYAFKNILIVVNGTANFYYRLKYDLYFDVPITSITGYWADHITAYSENTCPSNTAWAVLLTETMNNLMLTNVSGFQTNVSRQGNGMGRLPMISQIGNAKINKIKIRNLDAQAAASVLKSGNVIKIYGVK